MIEVLIGLVTLVVVVAISYGIGKLVGAIGRSDRMMTGLSIVFIAGSLGFLAWVIGSVIRGTLH